MFPNRFETYTEDSLDGLRRYYLDQIHQVFATVEHPAWLVGSLAIDLLSCPEGFPVKRESGDLRDLDFLCSHPDDAAKVYGNDDISVPVGNQLNAFVVFEEGGSVRLTDNNGFSVPVPAEVFSDFTIMVDGYKIKTLPPRTLFHLQGVRGPLREKDFESILKCRRLIRQYPEPDESKYEGFHAFHRHMKNLDPIYSSDGISLAVERLCRTLSAENARPGSCEGQVVEANVIRRVKETFKLCINRAFYWLASNIPSPDGFDIVEGDGDFEIIVPENGEFWSALVRTIVDIRRLDNLLDEVFLNSPDISAILSELPAEFITSQALGEFLAVPIVRKLLTSPKFAQFVGSNEFKTFLSSKTISKLIQTPADLEQIIKSLTPIFRTNTGEMYPQKFVGVLLGNNNLRRYLLSMDVLKLISSKEFISLLDPDPEEIYYRQSLDDPFGLNNIYAALLPSMLSELVYLRNPDVETSIQFARMRSVDLRQLIDRINNYHGSALCEDDLVKAKRALNSLLVINDALNIGIMPLSELQRLVTEELAVIEASIDTLNEHPHKPEIIKRTGSLHRIWNEVYQQLTEAAGEEEYKRICREYQSEIDNL